MSRAQPLVLVSLLGAAGCVAFDETGLPGADQTLAERLAVRAELALEAPSLVGVAAFDGAGQALPAVAPAVRDGRAVLRATADAELLLVEDLEIDLDDVRVEAGVVADEPIELTGVRLRLGTQIVLAPRWHPGGMHATGVGRADLLVDWAVRDERGAIVPLATQRVRDVEFAVDARLTSTGEVTAVVQAAVDGPVWRFGDRVELADLSLAVHARAPAAP